ncbi:Methyltransferase-like protein 21B [Linderina pennispora]|nr:Methyltransferase-like protein 21B [Linderina pennispora]
MELVKWQFRNPYHDAQHDSTRTFLFGPHTVTLSQQPELQIDRHHNTGFLVWDGAYILSTFIHHHLQLSAKSCLELGAGNALVSIVARLKGAERVIATDLDDYLDFIKGNIQQNPGPAGAPEIEVRHLRWGDDHPGIGKVDVVFGSEILYLQDLHQALLATLQQLMHKDSVAYFIYKNRSLGEHAFQAAAAHSGFKIVELPKTFLDSEFQDDPYHLLRLQLS